MSEETEEEEEELEEEQSVGSTEDTDAISENIGKYLMLSVMWIAGAAVFISAFWFDAWQKIEDKKIEVEKLKIEAQERIGIVRAGIEARKNASILELEPGKVPASK